MSGSGAHELLDVPADAEPNRVADLQRKQALVGDRQGHRARDLEAGVLRGAHVLLLFLAAQHAPDGTGNGAAAWRCVALGPPAGTCDDRGEHLFTGLQEWGCAVLDLRFRSGHELSSVGDEAILCGVHPFGHLRHDPGSASRRRTRGHGHGAEHERGREAVLGREGRPGATRFVMIAATICAPSAPPIVRMIVFMPVATPVCDCGTARRSGSPSTANASPMPTPMSAPQVDVPRCVVQHREQAKRDAHDTCRSAAAARAEAVAERAGDRARRRA